MSSSRRQLQSGSAERVSLMTCDALFSLAPCTNRSFSSSTCRFAAQAQCFVSFYVCVAKTLGFAFPGIRFEVFLLGTIAQAFARVSFLLAMSYNRLVLTCFKSALFAQSHRHYAGESFPGRVAHIARMQSQPSRRCGWVESLLLWRGAHCENAKRTLCALRAGRIALAVARRIV